MIEPFVLKITFPSLESEACEQTHARLISMPGRKRCPVPGLAGAARDRTCALEAESLLGVPVSTRLDGDCTG